MAHTIGLIGLGKIAQTRHLPTIAASLAFRLQGAASPEGGDAGPGIPVFPTHQALLAALPRLSAVAICTPPDIRCAIARDALRAGCHVLLEKPPSTSSGELAALRRLAADTGRVLFTAWHSQHNAAVAQARDILAGRRIATLRIVWNEDWRQYHPGQKWIFQAGGFGVFDAAINGLSILTRILPQPLFVTAARLFVPTDAETPVAATLHFSTGHFSTGAEPYAPHADAPHAPDAPSPDAPNSPDAPMTAHFDWRAPASRREITLTTTDGLTLKLTDSGGRLETNGIERLNTERREYPDLYDRFDALIQSGESEVDEAPLTMVADAFLMGTRTPVPPNG